MLAGLWQWSVFLLVTSLFLEGGQIELKEHSTGQIELKEHPTGQIELKEHSTGQVLGAFWMGITGLSAGVVKTNSL